MFIHERWLPLRQIPDEGAAGGEAPATEAPAPTETPAPSGPGSGRSELRQQLEKGFSDDRKATEKAEKGAAKAKTPKRVAGGAEIEPVADPAVPAEGAEAPVEGAEGQPAPQATVAAPAGFSAEAKAAWATTPPAVQAAIAKRESDMAKGVEELRGRYGELDKALEPHLESIRRHGQTPGKAVEQLFGWFQALAVNPGQAFPALAKSFNLDLNQIMAGQQQQQTTPGQQPAPGQPTVDPGMQQYITDMQNRLAAMEQGFTQKLGTVETQIQQQAESKTNEVLAMWSKDKPHFEAVRKTMANLISSGTVPLKDGQVDLDSAYDMAIYAMPDVRTQVLKSQQEAQAKAAAAKVDAEKKAQQAQVDRARKANVAITGSAPGVPSIAGKPRGPKKSVRESIMEARQELEE